MLGVKRVQLTLSRQCRNAAMQAQSHSPYKAQPASCCALLLSRAKSTFPEFESDFLLDEEGIQVRNAFSRAVDSVQTEVADFPGSIQPVLLNSKVHAVGYLSKILNARVYEAAIETELQHAGNLSEVSSYLIQNKQ